MMMSPLSQRTYGGTMLEEFENPNDPMEFQPATLPEYTNAQGEPVAFPHAGLLTSPMILARHPTTPTNVNRHRARMILLWFLGTDILKTADQPVDQTQITAINPQRDDPNCSVCHAVVDSIAGTFQAFQPYYGGNDIDELGVLFHPEPDWFDEMWPAGLDEDKLPLEAAPYGLQWLGGKIAYDERFALSTVFNIYRGLTGSDPLIAPKDYADALYEQRFAAFLTQSEVFRAVAHDFRTVPYNGTVNNVKVIVKELVLSPYFRAVNALPLAPEELVKLDAVGMGHLLTPEQLNRKIKAVLGIPWADNDFYDGYSGRPYLDAAPRDPTDSGVYQLFYGGVDFVEATARIKDPNGLMAAVAERMAVEMACQAAPQDMALPGEDRLLFPTVEIGGVTYDPRNLTPESGGLEVPDAVAGIKQTIAHLHKHILGENFQPGHPEVERTYQLFLETWREGNEKLALQTGEVFPELPDRCWAVADFWTGNPIPAEQQVTTDEKYTIRSWMAVLTYLLSDYAFLYE
jgi:hypothetical protein